MFLHPNTWPFLKQEQTGGMILDLKEGEVLMRLENLLKTHELDSEFQLDKFLQNRIQANKRTRGDLISSLIMMIRFTWQRIVQFNA